ncbi:hypothetical protein EJ03DRAFT_347341 [Teratosphaeria nubilosa]|uniref:Pentacotripeptide-repeat region of PRORP domain-containing protein n=1 Tax=Teratosphaeria nubilosa TaxID=161662 RepID=A0A6G1LM56_9PEZI|nr:hypothetical protein EJ03DRAFT_347341 [Teratosphaeria nubilosa]
MATPSELLKAGQALGLGSYLKDRHVEAMWKLAARIVGLRESVQKDPGVRAWHDGLLHELVTLWNMALEIKLRRLPTIQSGIYQIRTGPPSTSMHWSFLPSNIAKLLSIQDLAKTTTRSFSDVIGLLVPSHHSEWNPRTKEHYEYPSTALVTLDELRLRARSMDGLTAESWQNYKPLMDLLADILKQYSVTSMPVALAEKLISPMKEDFRAITKRLGLRRKRSDEGQRSQQFAQTDVTRPRNSGQEKGENIVTVDTAVDTRDPGSEMGHIAASASGEAQEAPSGQEKSEDLATVDTAVDTRDPASEMGHIAASTSGEAQETPSGQEKSEDLATINTAVDTRDPASDMGHIAGSASPEAQEAHTSDNGVASDPNETPNVGPSLEAATMPGVDAPSNNVQDFGPHTAFVNNQLKWLGKAWQQHSLQQALRCKQEILALAREPAGKDLPHKIFEHLMLTLLALRNPWDAIVVWNFFVGELGRQPTAQTYTVMMRGAQYVRDIKAMESFWRKMRNAGIKPDAHTWSTRIFGLIQSSNTVLGMKAMDELSQEWTEAARANRSAHPGSRSGQTKVKTSAADEPLVEADNKSGGDVDGVTKPNLVIMNAAISALASKGEHMIPKVLDWGRRFGLEPDLVTHNVLLNLSMRHGKPDEAISILQRMSQKGIDPNSQTWTILLSAMFEGDQLHNLSHEQQQTQVMSFIASLESVTNVGIDQKGYALIIDRLLARYSNTTAANTVLQHMISKGLQPTTHILTILMRFYFQRRPVPDFAAAEALWSQVMNRNSGLNVNLDSIFYDRAIEMYARYHTVLGSTQPMMRFLGRMLREQRRPSWRAMECAVRALAERKEWTRFQEMVDEARSWIKDGDQEIVVGARNFGQRDFWQFVLSTGVLRDEGIRRAEQLMRTRDGMGPLERRMQGVVQ